MPTLDLDLLGTNRLALAEYLDAETFDDDLIARRLSRKHREAFPNTLSLADRMFNRMRRRDHYGLQLSDLGWTTTSCEYPTAKCRPLSLGDVRHTLLGRRRVQSVGTTDRIHVDGLCTWTPPPIQCLRVDIDYPAFTGWLGNDASAVLKELRRERELCHLLGFKSEVFRTGGKGHQLIVALPAEVEFGTASSMVALLKLLFGSNDRMAPHIDKSNVDGILREPGGRHLNGELSLFVDVDAGRLYDLPIQTQLMVNAFSCSPGDWKVEDFRLASEELQVEVRKLGRELVRSTEEDAQVLLQSSSSPIVHAFRRAIEPKAWISQPEAPSQPVPARSQQVESVGSGMGVQKAQAIFHIQLKAKEFFYWFIPSGTNGVSAAYRLFGKDALEQLIQKAKDTPYVSTSDLEDRLKMIRGFWRTFQPPKGAGQNDLNSIRNAWDSAEAQIADLRLRLGKPKWKSDSVTAFLAVLLGKMESENTENVRIGLNAIETLASQSFSDMRFSHASMQRARKILLDNGILVHGKLVDASSEPDFYCLPTSARARQGIEKPLSNLRNWKSSSYYRTLNSPNKKKG